MSIFFEAEVIDWKYGDIALDDIEFRNEACISNFYSHLNFSLPKLVFKRVNHLENVSQTPVISINTDVWSEWSAWSECN